eukprot:TRINITY_DN3099_c0_g1_i2.p1 TRINITY_DN3099_c0_g1~~TRINITY_DN3099_c0_g1_i2.p1  ORF type:complete len:413 (-),score=80.95 TRINITY_DN3099_c0_g1_i2:378-1616(-)
MKMLKLVEPSSPLTCARGNCNVADEASLKFCVGHQFFYCNECFESIHKKEAFKAHKTVTPKIHRKFSNLFVHTPSPDFEEHKFFEFDLKSSSITAGLISHNKVLESKGIYSSFIGGNYHLLVTSFLGGTGSGKSSLSKFLCDSEFGLPIPGDLSSRSTSSDITAYVGKFSSKNSHKIRGPTHPEGFERKKRHTTYLILDSEGQGGTIPLSLKSDNADDKIIAKRAKYVEYVFPRLLYYFGDVLVYVHKGSPRESFSIARYLVNVAQTAQKKFSETNKKIRETKPNLLLIMNMVCENEGGHNWEVDHATNSFFESIREEDIKNYFQDIKVLYIPKYDNDIFHLRRQLKKMKQIIAEMLINTFNEKIKGQALMDKKELLQAMCEIVSATPKSLEDFVSEEDKEEVTETQPKKPE